MYGVTITELIKKMEFTNMTPEIDTDKIVVSHPEVNRPALQLTGFYAHFDNERVQMIGNVELAYLSGLEPQARLAMYDRLISSKIPCIVFCRGRKPDDEILALCCHYGVPCLLTEKTTSDAMAEVIRWLKAKLAPCISIHGVLVDVSGVGVLIMGESGIGKSEAALELIKRGHQLVADDVVDIRCIGENRLVGESPELVRHFMEIRGVGIIDIATMYGVGAVIRSKSIDMEVHLEMWQAGKEYDRLGMQDNYTEILGVKIPSLLLPIHPGRNLAVVLEVAARNFRLKQMGYNAAVELARRHMERAQRASEDDE